MKNTQVKKRTQAQAPVPDSPAEPSADAQRHRIASALGRCMRAKGFAATSLTDIAVAAGMSPSLMRYYFASREEILESYYRLVSDRIMADILKIERATPEQWLSEYCAYSIGAGTDRAALALLIETFAVAMHHEPLNRLKTRYDGFAARIYGEFFQWAGTAPGLGAHEAAQMARTFELGIKLGAVFQRRLRCPEGRSDVSWRIAQARRA